MTKESVENADNFMEWYLGKVDYYVNELQKIFGIKVDELKVGEEEIFRFVLGCVTAGRELVEQNPTLILTLIRGGKLHGNHVCHAAGNIASRLKMPFDPYERGIHASGLSRKGKVADEIRETFEEFKRKLYEYREESKGTPFENTLAHITLIDSGYTGRSYEKALRIALDVFSESQISGILLIDNLYNVDKWKVGQFKHLHQLTGGRFKVISLPLIYEDKNVDYHMVERGNVQFYFPWKSRDYVVVSEKVDEFIEKLIDEMYGNNPAEIGTRTSSSAGKHSI